MADIACDYPSCERVWNVMPSEYQGWFIVLLLIMGAIAIVYSLYRMTGENPYV